MPKVAQLAKGGADGSGPLERQVESQYLDLEPAITLRMWRNLETGFETVVLGLSVINLPRNFFFLQIQIVEYHPRPTFSETWWVGPSHLARATVSEPSC